MIYIVRSVKVVKLVGKEKKALTLEGGDGAMVAADIWNDFPGYDGVSEGSTVEGDIVQKGSYSTLYAPRGARLRPASSGATMQRMAIEKRESIKEAQENKEKSIKIASGFRDSTLILTTCYADEIMKLPLEERKYFIEDKHKELFNWYTKNWDIESGEIPF